MNSKFHDPFSFANLIPMYAEQLFFSPSSGQRARNSSQPASQPTFYIINQTTAPRAHPRVIELARTHNLMFKFPVESQTGPIGWPEFRVFEPSLNQLFIFKVGKLLKISKISKKFQNNVCSNNRFAYPNKMSSNRQTNAVSLVQLQLMLAHRFDAKDDAAMMSHFELCST